MRGLRQRAIYTVALSVFLRVTSFLLQTSRRQFSSSGSIYSFGRFAVPRMSNIEGISEKCSSLKTNVFLRLTHRTNLLILRNV